MLETMAATPNTDLTYYSEARAPDLAFEPLVGVEHVDVGVVGGGLAGLSAALFLAEGGFRVGLLEARTLGSGASGRNGGQVLPGVAASQTHLRQLVGAADANRIWDLSLQGMQLLKTRIARHQIDCDWRDGHLHVADKPRQLAELAAWQRELRDDYGYSHTALLDRAALRARLDSPLYLGALYDAAAGHLHPLRYLLGLARAARRVEVRIHEHSRALGYDQIPSGTLRIRTATGELRCQHLLLAGNAELGAVAPRLARKILPVRTFMLATEPLGEERAAALIPGNASVSDMNWILDYFRRSADHRLLFGGRVSYASRREAHQGEATRRRMVRVFPGLAGARIDHAWSGLLDLTMNRAPHFGRLAPNVWFLQGFSGHGLALTGIAGQLVAEAIAGTAERFDVFARIPHRSFPGGAPLRRPLLALAMLWYRLRDRL
jgi:gamma-glutamylputrescine oxidase